MSLETWKIFSGILHHHILDPALFNFGCVISQPKSPLRVYTAALVSRRFEFLTSLSLSSDFSNAELTKLTDITNLAILEINNSSKAHDSFAVGDRLLREWHRAALAEGAFSVLQFLRFWGFENVTNTSLTYLNAFPSLVAYEVGDCSVRYEYPPPSGWSRLYKGNFSSALQGASLEHGPHLKPQQSSELEQSETSDKMRFISMPGELQSMNKPALSNCLEPDDSRESSEQVDTWETMTYRLLPLVSAIRNSSNLARAETVARGEAAAGDALLNSTPIVSLRLGKKSDLKRKVRHISYIRTDLLHPFNSRDPRTGGQRASGQGGEHSREVPTKPATVAQSVIKSKKRKLNDLLSSFL